MIKKTGSITLGILVALLLVTSSCISAGNASINVIGHRLAATEELERLIPEFEERTGIKVNLELVPEAVIHEKLAIEMASKRGAYDVALIGFARYPEFAKAGLIENLEPYIENKPDTIWFDLDDFYKGFIDSLKWEGDIYGLPFFQTGGILMYRKDLFEEYGVEVPESMDELEEAAAKLTRDTNNDGKIDIYGLSMRGTRAPFSNLSAGFIYSYGGTILDENMQPKLTSQEALDGISKYVTLLRKYGPPGSAGYDWMEIQTDFVQGKVAMIIEATDYAGRIEDPEISSVVGKVGYALMPKEKYPMGYLYTEGVSILSTSKSKDARGNLYNGLQARTSN